MIGEQAVRIGIDKARACGIAMVGLRDVGHVGRIGDWAEMAAEAGQVSLHFVGTTGLGALMVPFGGTDRRLSLCVVAAGVPRASKPPVIYDIATSVVAEGKVFVAKNKGVRLPEGHLIAKDGKPTTDPNDLYAGGALLPFGGHKGSGLAIVADLLAGALTGAGTSARREQEMVNTMCSIYVDPDRLPDRAAFDAEVDALVDWVKGSPPAEAGGEVLVPGDIERRTRESVCATASRSTPRPSARSPKPRSRWAWRATGSRRCSATPTRRPGAGKHLTWQPNCSSLAMAAGPRDAAGAVAAAGAGRRI